MHFFVSIIFNFSVFIAGILGMLKYNHIHKSYYPFIYFIWAGCLNETVSLILAMNGYYTFVNNNIYVFSEALLLLWFFKNMRLFKKSTKLYYSLFISLVIFWLIENLIAGKVMSVSIYFRIFYAFIVVLLSVTIINLLIMSIRKNILTNADFLICITFILYFTFKILIEAFWIYGLNQSNRFQLLVYDIMDYINLVCNLMYAYAILWMSRKQIFTMPS